MSLQQWQETIATLTQDATAHANTTTEGIIVPNVVIPANYMQNGRVLRLRLFGKLSNTASATIIFAIRWGGVSGTLLATTEAITPGAAVTDIGWMLEALIQTRANGSAGSLIVMGNVVLSLTASTSFSQAFGVSGFDAPAAVGSLDLTADTALSITGDWSAASSSNTLTALLYTLESLN
jgi:hypothetical protein